MKKSMFILPLLAVMFAGCSNDTENDGLNGKASVMLNLSSDLSYSRAFNESEYKNTANYQVEFVKTETSDVVYSGKYSDMPLEPYKVDPGVSYTVTASYGEDVAAGYDKLYVKETQTFAVAEGDNKTINLVCKPANARLKLAYSDDYTNFYSDCKVSVKTSFMNEPWEMGIADKGKELFMKTGDKGTKATLSFTVYDLDGKPVEVNKDLSQELSLNPRDSYTLTLEPELNEIAGGKIGINVTINSEVTEEDITIQLPGELL